MKGIKGQLSSLPITDLMQWIDMNKKSGVLFVLGETSSKCFCFEDGKLLLAASNEPGRRLGEFLAKEGQVGLKALGAALNETRGKGGSLLGYMVGKKIIPEEFLKVSIQQLAEDTITDVLSWGGGAFEFVEELPMILTGSPVKLNTNFIVFESVRKHDEVQKQLGLR